ncbi:methyltransferase [Actinoplanes philippinensis]|uniref:Methyltransferase domain-containing protein n=1 Tax=Actinoplanes philippinensis TaxID=35752 RepID=A0A1I2I0F7_9ACTN|nr:class I SAM-dependent methyltransferase [Actinoplanes philippinensis]GIE78832.1 methyltransferase [Actinoplanes philippinensis]SFF35113.1 Methyltransferase domain-containing protein [Actinoplanes philippinensis]
MRVPEWLDQTRISYDTVAASYADLLRGRLAEEPFQRGILGLFAELVRGRGPVVDVGCGPGRITGFLRGLGVDVFGVDLSPGMVEQARRDHPGLRFEVGSMTALEVADGSLGGVLAWFSLIHVPDEAVPGVLAQFCRVLAPGGVVLLGFHAGEGVRHVTEGYGGHPMNVLVHRRSAARVAGWLVEAGFTVEGELVHRPDPKSEGVFLFAHR